MLNLNSQTQTNSQLFTNSKMKFFRIPKLSPSHYLAFFFVTLLTLTSLASSSNLPQSHTNFIKQKCRTTTYASLCTKMLIPCASAVKSNPLKLCNAALKVAISATYNCSASVMKLAKQKGFTRLESRAVKDCIGDMKEAVYELKQTVNAMGHLKDTDREFQWANAKTYASAAITDAETCVDAVLERKVSVAVRKKIRGCVSDVEKHISNALSLINHLY